jgi:hypothetical protein
MQLEKLVKSLRSHGVEYLKTPDLEVRLEVRLAQYETPGLGTPDSPISAKVEHPDVRETPPEKMDTNAGGKIPHKVVEALTMSDEDLLGKLFPDPTAEDKE